LEPIEYGVGVADRCAEPDSLDVVLGDTCDALEDAHQVCPAVCPCDRVHLVDHDSPQVCEQPTLVDALGNQHDLERLRGGHEKLRRLLQEPPAMLVGSVSVPHEPPQADHLRVQPKSFGLVVQQGLDGSNVDGTHAVRCVFNELR